MDIECVKLSMEITSHLISGENDQAMIKQDRLQCRMRMKYDGAKK